MRFLTIVFVVASFPAFGWQDTNSRAPILIPAPDHVSPSVRAARNNIYAPLLIGMPSLLSKPPGGPPLSSIAHGTPQPELPVGKSQVVLVGKVISITPWLVTGDTGLYSEYRIDVSSILMNHSSWQQGTILDLVGVGGLAQIEKVGILSHLVSGSGHQIETGSTYLLFLNFQPTAQCFTFVKAWDVSSGHVIAVSNDDLYRVTRNTSMVNGLPLETVVAQIQALVNAL
jgi:hypothetical protein